MLQFPSIVLIMCSKWAAAVHHFARNTSSVQDEGRHRSQEGSVPAVWVTVHLLQSTAKKRYSLRWSLLSGQQTQSSPLSAGCSPVGRERHGLYCKKEGLFFIRPSFLFIILFLWKAVLFVPKRSTTRRLNWSEAPLGLLMHSALFPSASLFLIFQLRAHTLLLLLLFVALLKQEFRLQTALPPTVSEFNLCWFHQLMYQMCFLFLS